MNLKAFGTLFTLFMGLTSLAQVSINTDGSSPDPNAILDIKSSNKGLLIPRMLPAEYIAMTNPATGLLVFDTDSNQFAYYNGTEWELITGDNLGNHTATQNIRLGNYALSGDGDSEGVYVTPEGNVGLRIGNPATPLGILGSNGFDYVGITQAQVGGGYSMELTTPDALGAQATRMLLQGGADDPDIAFYTGARTSESPTFFVEGSNGRVGIGTTTPVAKLHLVAQGDGANILELQTERAWSFQQEGTGSGSALRLRNTAGNDKRFSIDTDGNTHFRRQNGSATAMYIDHFNTTVGIGTTTPTSRLDLAGGNISLNGGWISNDGGNEGIRIGDNGRVGIGSLPGNATRFLVTGDNNWGYAGLFQSTGTAFALAAIGPATTNPVFFVDTPGNDDLFTVRGDGRSGFGDATPTQAKVVINGSGTHTLSYGYLNSSGNTGTQSGTNSYSLYASHRIAASEFNAHSDARIKHVIGQSDGGQDLDVLMGIQVTDYTMIDTLDKGARSFKKVIAQQVENVYPQAVTNNVTEVVPDIYRRASVEDGWVALATDLKPGERVKIITEKGTDVHEVLDAMPDRFRVAGLEGSDADLGTVFVYGREVDDFHTVDYEAIAMLNVSATQEQQRRIEQLEAENRSLRSSLIDLTAMVQQIQQSLAGQ